MMFYADNLLISLTPQQSRSDKSRGFLGAPYLKPPMRGTNWRTLPNRALSFVTVTWTESQVAMLTDLHRVRNASNRR
jgi:hypothetical protein